MLHPIDVVTNDNKPTGRLSNPEDANNHGLWHRGVSVAMYTSNGKVLLQKRSKDIMYHPDTIDFGVSGYVDAGETPEQAAVREIKEETGLKIDMSRLKFITVTKFNHNWRYGTRHKKSRVILYHYAYRLDNADCFFVPQEREVAWIKLVSLRSAQWLVRRHFIKRLGILSPRYSQYRHMLQTIKSELRTS